MTTSAPGPKRRRQGPADASTPAPPEAALVADVATPAPPDSVAIAANEPKPKNRIPMKSSNVEWSFRYSGPIKGEPHPRCVTCDASRKKECPTHGSSFTRGCAHCDAAQGAPCQAHWGLEAALTSHPTPTDERMVVDQSEVFALVRKEVADLAEPDHKAVDIHLRGSIICLESGGVRREHVVDVTIR